MFARVTPPMMRRAPTRNPWLHDSTMKPSRDKSAFHESFNAGCTAFESRDQRKGAIVVEVHDDAWNTRRGAADGGGKMRRACGFHMEWEWRLCCSPAICLVVSIGAAFPGH